MTCECCRQPIRAGETFIPFHRMLTWGKGLATAMEPRPIGSCIHVRCLVALFSGIGGGIANLNDFVQREGP